MKDRDYRVWSAEEEQALRAGVQKHGLGAWEIIRHDDAFRVLGSRTGVQLKDKWRNLIKFKHLHRGEAASIPVRTSRTRKMSRMKRPIRTPVPCVWLDGNAYQGDGTEEKGTREAYEIVSMQKGIANRLTPLEKHREDNIERNKQALAKLLPDLSTSLLYLEGPSTSSATEKAKKKSCRRRVFPNVEEAIIKREAAKAEEKRALKACVDANIMLAKVTAEMDRADPLAAKKLSSCLQSREAANMQLKEASSRMVDANSVLARAVAEEDEAPLAYKGRNKTETPRRFSARAAALPRRTYQEEGGEGSSVLSFEEGFTKSKIGRKKGYGSIDEDRRYGIYDERRYIGLQLSHQVDAEDTPPEPEAHQGDEWTVNCTCGVDYDDGKKMIVCDWCNVWYHVECVKVDDHTIEMYKCKRCSRREKAKERRKRKASGQPIAELCNPKTEPKFKSEVNGVQKHALHQDLQDSSVPAFPLKKKLMAKVYLEAEQKQVRAKQSSKLLTDLNALPEEAYEAKPIQQRSKGSHESVQGKNSSGSRALRKEGTSARSIPPKKHLKLAGEAPVGGSKPLQTSSVPELAEPVGLSDEELARRLQFEMNFGGRRRSTKV